MNLSPRYCRSRDTQNERTQSVDLGTDRVAERDSDVVKDTQNQF